MPGRADRRLYLPIDRLKPLDDDLWVADGGLIRFYGLGFPTRMVAVRLPDGAMWLHSPIAWSAGLEADVLAAGPVGHLVAPNTIHYAFLPGWAERFPAATVHAAPGVAARAARRGVAFPAHRVLGDRAPPAWAGVIDQRLVEGHPFLKEVAFFHRASRTLILADLIENFEAAKLGPVMRLAARLAGILAPRGKAPVDMRLSWRDRAAARAAIDEIIGWAPRRIVMAHGAIIETDATERLAQAFRWLGPSPAASRSRSPAQPASTSSSAASKSPVK